MRALTTTELENCAGGIKTVTVAATRIHGSSSGGYNYNYDDTSGGWDATSASNFQYSDPVPLAQQTGFGPNGAMGFFQHAGWCIDNPGECIGLGADMAVSIVEQAWNEGYRDFSAAMIIGGAMLALPDVLAIAVARQFDPIDPPTKGLIEIAVPESLDPVDPIDLEENLKQPS